MEQFQLKMESPPSIIADVHSHTVHSHGQGTVEQMYLAARERGLGVYGFSEHSPRPEGYVYPTDYQARLSAGFSRYIEEVRAIAARGAAEGMSVLLGLEVDYIPGREAYAKALCEAHDYDYVIGGLHFQGTWGFDYSPDEWAPLPREARFAAYARYYADLAAMCRTGLFHIAAHPDLIKLFSASDFHAWLDTPEASVSIDAALTAMRDNGVIMEVSSAGLRKPCKEIYPCPAIMRRAAAMGLAISFASDAHCVNTPAYAFDELARYAAGFGFTHSTIVERGAPRSLAFTPPA